MNKLALIISLLILTYMGMLYSNYDPLSDAIYRTLLELNTN